MPKRTRKKKSLKKDPSQSSDVWSGFENEIGAGLRSNSKKDIMKVDGPVEVESFDVAHAKSDPANVEKKEWGGMYRGLAKGMDELVSTASVRYMLKGALKGSKPTSSDYQVLNKFFNALSAIRFPTKYTGFAKKNGDRMQHPTTKEEAIWRSDGKLGPHNSLDKSRRTEVYKAMKEAMDRNGSLNDVLNAGIERAISFTVNEFAAPATANDQSPARRNGETLYQQVKLREILKEVAMQYGAVQEQGSTSIDRDWGDRAGRRTISPRRTLRPADETAVRRIPQVANLTPSKKTRRRTQVKVMMVTGTLPKPAPQPQGNAKGRGGGRRGRRGLAPTNLRRSRRLNPD